MIAQPLDHPSLVIFFAPLQTKHLRCTGFTRADITSIDKCARAGAFLRYARHRGFNHGNVFRLDRECEG